MKSAHRNVAKEKHTSRDMRLKKKATEYGAKSEGDIMAKVHKTDYNAFPQYVFHCTACGCSHGWDDRWTFNGDLDKPTISPSLLVSSRHPKGYSNENPAPVGWQGEYEKTICHSFVTDGKIQYLSDCTHKYAGQTIELEDWE